MQALRDGRLDAARGVGILLMVAYHFTWDLAALGFIDPAHAATPAFRRTGAAIASLFLFVSGMALALARAAAPDDAAFRAKFLSRLAILAGAAALVSLGTWLAMGERFVRFGILHCIATAGLIAWPLLGAPTAAVLAGATALLALPFLVDLPAFAHPALLWLGLSSAVPRMVDYVPLAPFGGVLLLGVAAGRRLPPPTRAPEPGLLQRIGRLSLPIYLVHQPILYGGLFLLAAVMFPAARDQSGAIDRDTAGFRMECRRACEAQGNGRAHCDRYCDCAEREMKATDLWARAMTGAGSAALQQELATLTQACFARTRGAD